MSVLQNKTILITRPKEQAEEFFLKLEQLGAIPIAFPLIHIVPINQPELIKIYTNNNFDWIIFTSGIAVKCFFEIIHYTKVKAKIAVVGSKTEEELNKYHLKAVFIPSDFTAETLAKEIPINENDTILIPQSNLAKSNLVKILRNRKVNTYSISSYQNCKVKYTNKELRELFNKKIDFITFTSGSTINAFVKLNIKINNSKVVCIGPETAKVAVENKIRVDAIANPRTIEGIIDAIVSFC
ncbi:MAG: hypothetical protein COX70_09375 [Flavobacteriales bacterium CG_4_10_14_0_2_um_filter_32_8]|nr:MAG: hypothetical protein COX70_09375 [Flavobacteriales bacterium CG_4_10_14_0_2_um_filter_32_8]PJB15462.1 MAG: hypothetical protein CO118_03395 [Flavobacteriales bacterium CG_4_9_14_3_um_filter_32_8]